MSAILFAVNNVLDVREQVEALRGQGHEVEVIVGGQVALDILKVRAGFNLLVADIEIPEVNGHLASEMGKGNQTRFASHGARFGYLNRGQRRDKEKRWRLYFGGNADGRTA
ncbi:MAG: hypothetical protein Q7S05_01235 [bacterium]|nr:hypothetical protein [bacterium]